MSLYWNVDYDDRSFSRFRVNDQAASHDGRAFADADQAHAAAPGRLVLLRHESDAVVDDGQDHVAASSLEADADARRLGMLVDVGEDLLRDAVDVRLAIRRQSIVAEGRSPEVHREIETP